MNRDFVMELTPRNARLLMHCIESCNMKIDPKIMLLSKKDRVDWKQFDDLEVNDIQRSLIQHIVDLNYRIIIPFEDKVEAYDAITKALALKNKTKAIFVNTTLSTKNKKHYQPIKKISSISEIDPDIDGWYMVNCIDLDKLDFLQKLKDFVIVSSDDHLFETVMLITPQVIVTHQLSSQYKFTIKEGGSMTIASLRNVAKQLYPPLVNTMPKGTGKYNFKKRGKSLFPLMGVFSGYISKSDL